MFLLRQLNRLEAKARWRRYHGPDVRQAGQLLVGRLHDLLHRRRVDLVRLFGLGSQCKMRRDALGQPPSGVLAAGDFNRRQDRHEGPQVSGPGEGNRGGD